MRLAAENVMAAITWPPSDPQNVTIHGPPFAPVTVTWAAPIEVRAWSAAWTVAADAFHARVVVVWAP